MACVATLTQVMRQMKKSHKKNREKFNKLKFLRQNHRLRHRVATQAIFTARWQHDNVKKIASPSQAENRSCSRGFMYVYNCKESNDFLSCGTKTPIEPGFHMSGKFQTIGDFCPKFS